MINIQDIKKEISNSIDNIITADEELVTLDVVQDKVQQTRINIANVLSEAVNQIPMTELLNDPKLSEAHNRTVKTTLAALKDIETSQLSKVNAKIRKQDSDGNDKANEIVTEFLLQDSDRREASIKSLTKLINKGSFTTASDDTVDNLVKEHGGCDDINNFELKEDPYDFDD